MHPKWEWCSEAYGFRARGLVLCAAGGGRSYVGQLRLSVSHAWKKQQPRPGLCWLQGNREGEKVAYRERVDLPCWVRACEERKLHYPLQRTTHRLSAHCCELIRVPLCSDFSSRVGILIKPRAIEVAVWIMCYYYFFFKVTFNKQLNRAHLTADIFRK